MNLIFVPIQSTYLAFYENLENKIENLKKNVEQ